MRAAFLLCITAASSLADDAPTRFERFFAPACDAFVKRRFADAERLSRKCIEADSSRETIDPCVTMLALALRRQGRLEPMLEQWRRELQSPWPVDWLPALDGLLAAAIDRGDFVEATIWARRLVDLTVMKP